MKSLFLFLFVYPIVSLNDRQLNMIRNNVPTHWCYFVCYEVCSAWCDWISTL